MERSTRRETRSGSVDRSGPTAARNGEVPSLVRSLVKIAELDTAYRGEYLRLAHELLTDSLPRNEYLRLKQTHRRLGEIMEGAHRATDLGEWEQVEALARQAEELRETLARREDLLRMGDSVYAAPPVRMTSFAAALNGLTAHPVSGLDRLRSDLVRELLHLEQIDRPKASFYEQRRRHFEQLQIARQPEDASAAADVSRPRDALRAAIGDHDWRRAEQLAHALASRASPGLVVSGGVDPARLRELANPYPAHAIEAAAPLGLRLVELADSTVLRDYVARAAPAASAPVEGRLAENLDLLASQAFVNSAGLRYLPAFASEIMLVEPFGEDDRSATSPLLERLELGRRRGATRKEIENALFAYGHRVLEALRLDPMQFSLVCIPFDAYLRLAPALGWGRAPVWTHFDGYQLTAEDHLRALVGGDVRYGGPADLCSVGGDYADDHITARFAVVRRMRLVVGSGA